MDKAYDRDYFDNWYRRRGINAGAALTRKVALAVSMAEWHLGRPIRTVLDIGCGEGVWRAPLLRLRPRIDYLGFDGSEYAIHRYGARRNLRLARFEEFEHLRPVPPVDLLLCVDVLHYLDTRELRAGLSAFGELCSGMAWIETYCAEDDIEGDMVQFQLRNADWYRREFTRAGLVACGNHGYLTFGLANNATALELPASPRR